MGLVARHHRDLEVHQRAYAAAMEIFRLTKRFPKEETYSMIDQMRRSSRSITTNIAEAWGKRRYEASFVAKLTDSLGELGETEDWLRYAVDCEDLDPKAGESLGLEYQLVRKTLNAMILHASSWCSKETSYKQQATSNKPQATSP